MADVNMPKLSDTMEEGTVLTWKAQEGDQVKRGDVLAEVESDKASFDLEAEAAGYLHIVVDQGKPVPVGDLIARIGDSKEAEAPAETAEASTAEASTAAGAQAAPAPGEAEAAPEASPAPAAEPAAGPQAGADEQLPGGVRASPLARRLARENGVDLTGVSGTGPGGRIVKEDVLRAAEQATAAPAATPPAAAPAPATAASTAPAPAAPPRSAAPRPTEGAEVVQPTRMQATIARRMVLSRSTVPSFYVTVEARVDDLVKLRRQLKESVPAAERVTVTDFVTRAVAIALTRFPEVNASWVEDHFERKRAVNIGIAVPPAEGMGLLVPVVHDCDQKDVIQISLDTRQAIERSRAGRPSDADLSGGTFSISNLGMYGVDEFEAIINPPEAAILAVGQLKEVPLVENGQVVIGSVMRMTLSCDHRVFYGQTAAQFLGEVRSLLEKPLILALPAA
jgi:pyruvate dehydrogenase E2 component (dihydrolipoamide acetyltransferase)